MGRFARLWQFLRGLVRRLVPPRTGPPSVAGTQVTANHGIVIVTNHIHVHHSAPPPLPVQPPAPLEEAGGPDEP